MGGGGGGSCLLLLLDLPPQCSDLKSVEMTTLGSITNVSFEVLSALELGAPSQFCLEKAPQWVKEGKCI